MSNNLPPIPQDQIGENFKWREWFRNLGSYIQQSQLGNIIVGITQGGTGATTATQARSNLGIGSLATQDYNNVAITGGLIDNTAIRLPYFAAHDTTTQTVGTINTPTLVTVNTSDYGNLITLASSRITFIRAGLYNIQFSVQATNSDTQAHDFAIWLRKNGTDVANSDSVATVTGTHGGQPGYNVVAANIALYLNNTDYIEFWWSTNSTQLQLNTLPAITTPFTAPAAPGVIVTASYMSAL